MCYVLYVAVHWSYCRWSLFILFVQCDGRDFLSVSSAFFPMAAAGRSQREKIFF